MEYFAPKLQALLQNARHILLTAHERPDGDAIGAMLGLSHYLEQMGKSHLCFSNDRPAPYFDFLDIQRISSNPDDLRTQDFDVIVLLDIGDVKRTQATELLLKGEKKAQVVCIDHHPTRLEYEGRNVVDHAHINVQASSTAELIYSFLTHVGAPITRAMATSLLTGILTDTGGFANLATTPSAMGAAAELLERGAVLKEINDGTLKNKSLAMLRLWGIALSRLQRNVETGIISTALFQKDFLECGVDVDAVDGFANFLNGLDDAKAAFFLKELPDGLISGSYRTTQEGVDVSKMAAEYGGGGHVKAAGFTTPGTIIETPQGWTIKPA
ncbi:MAG: bifunctional oligoribonuclease/PAP phosphatase NrnA [Candidatus Nomurabacteria bacterium]|nr:MAG: bifunctional oligoribonuclease/PAP phosphatase NrnA [Candidatus Nomurabacteria bacterium]